VYIYIYLYIAFSIGKTHISKEERHFWSAPCYTVLNVIPKSISVNPKFLSRDDGRGERRAAVCPFPHGTARSLLTLKKTQKTPKETLLVAAEQADESRGVWPRPGADRAGPAAPQAELDTSEGVPTPWHRRTPRRGDKLDPQLRRAARPLPADRAGGQAAEAGSTACPRRAGASSFACVARSISIPRASFCGKRSSRLPGSLSAGSGWAQSRQRGQPAGTPNRPRETQGQGARAGPAAPAAQHTGDRGALGHRWGAEPRCPSRASPPSVSSATLDC